MQQRTSTLGEMLSQPGDLALLSEHKASKTSEQGGNKRTPRKSGVEVVIE